ncbi:hypothetical protein [uncultured Brevundimonas sp.]|uniref:hypothetical protein n=1 Tax=uncultured Brevundimonas sp. TaxID=213418 RepID=UPI0030EC82B9|tara:strand:- start:19261 stop:19989 length:729 start_codon:yes stop_codon:yes gene_type:complete
MLEAPDPLDDRALVRAEHDRQRRYVLGVAGLSLGAGFALASGLVLALVPPDEVPFPVWILWTGLVLSTMALAVSVQVLRRAQPDLTTDRLLAGEAHGDRLQRNRNHGLLYMMLPMMLMLIYGGSAAWKVTTGQVGPGNWTPWIMAPIAGLLPIILGLTLAGIGTRPSPKMRRHLDDEQTQIHRRDALSLGYLVILGGATALYLTGLWRVEIAVTLMPLVLAIGVQAAAVHFVLMERKAERLG